MVVIPASKRQAVATKLGLNEQYLYQCLTGRRKAAAECCASIERELYPEVTCDQLRDDLNWMRIPDPAWPHPDGRPCLDIAAPASAVEVA